VSRMWGTCTRSDTHSGLVVEPENPPYSRMAGFAEFGPQNLAEAVPEGIGGGMWRHSEGCIEVKQLHVERVAVGSRT
jgi:hypothetical protein